jgi:hypothetical protein
VESGENSCQAELLFWKVCGQRSQQSFDETVDECPFSLVPAPQHGMEFALERIRLSLTRDRLDFPQLG